MTNDKILLIGAGEAGLRVVNYIMKQYNRFLEKNPTVDTHVIYDHYLDTEYSVAMGLGINHEDTNLFTRMNIGKSGTGKKRQYTNDIALTVANDVKSMLNRESLLPDNIIIHIVTSTGGGSGSGVSNKLTKSLMEDGYAVVQVAIQDHDSMGNASNDFDFLQELQLLSKEGLNTLTKFEDNAIGEKAVNEKLADFYIKDAIHSGTGVVGQESGDKRTILDVNGYEGIYETNFVLTETTNSKNIANTTGYIGAGTDSNTIKLTGGRAILNKFGKVKPNSYEAKRLGVSDKALWAYYPDMDSFATILKESGDKLAKLIEEDEKMAAQAKIEVLDPRKARKGRGGSDTPTAGGRPNGRTTRTVPSTRRGRR